MGNQLLSGFERYWCERKGGLLQFGNNFAMMKRAGFGEGRWGSSYRDGTATRINLSRGVLLLTIPIIVVLRLVGYVSTATLSSRLFPPAPGGHFCLHCKFSSTEKVGPFVRGQKPLIICCGTQVYSDPTRLAIGHHPFSLSPSLSKVHKRSWWGTANEDAKKRRS